MESGIRSNGGDYFPLSSIFVLDDDAKLVGHAVFRLDVCLPMISENLLGNIGDASESGRVLKVVILVIVANNNDVADILLVISFSD